MFMWWYLFRYSVILFFELLMLVSSVVMYLVGQCVLRQVVQYEIILQVVECVLLKVQLENGSRIFYRVFMVLLEQLFVCMLVWKFLNCLFSLDFFFLFIVCWRMFVWLSEKLVMCCVMVIICFWQMIRLYDFLRMLVRDLVNFGWIGVIGCWLFLCSVQFVCELVFMGFGWYNVMSVEMLLKLLGFMRCMSECMGLLLSWNMFSELFWVSRLQVLWLLSGRCLRLSFLFWLVWMLLRVLEMMVRFCSFRKFILISLSDLYDGQLNCVMICLFCLCFMIGMMLSSGLDDMIILVVCIFYWCFSFLSLRVWLKIVLVLGFVLISVWNLFVFLQWGCVELNMLLSGMFLFIMGGGIVLVSCFFMLNGKLRMCLVFLRVCLDLIVLQVMIWVMCLELYFLVMQLMILLW